MHYHSHPTAIHTLCHKLISRGNAKTLTIKPYSQAVARATNARDKPHHSSKVTNILQSLLNSIKLFKLTIQYYLLLYCAVKNIFLANIEHRYHFTNLQKKYLTTKLFILLLSKLN